MRRALLLPLLLASGCGSSDFDDRYARQSNRLEAAQSKMQADLDNRLDSARAADVALQDNSSADPSPAAP